MKKFPLDHIITVEIATADNTPSDFYICAHLILRMQYEAGFSNNALHTNFNTAGKSNYTLLFTHVNRTYAQKKILNIIQLIAFETKTLKASPSSGNVNLM